MNVEQSLVKLWHERFGVKIGHVPMLVDKKTSQLRVSLILEEAKEFEEASESQNLTKIADALGDLLYVVYGAGVTYGIDLQSVFHEVHRSNMSKGDPEIIRAPNGKILKGKNWTPPNLKPILIDLGMKNGAA